MTNAFEDDALGLKLRGYAIVPNGFLEMKIGIYTPEIAETKVTQVTDRARARGFPLKCTAEPV